MDGATYRNSQASFQLSRSIHQRDHQSKSIASSKHRNFKYAIPEGVVFYLAFTCRCIRTMSNVDVRTILTIQRLFDKINQ